MMKKVRNIIDIKVVKASHLIKVNPDGNPHHEANVEGWNIVQRVNKNFTSTSVDYTLEDLKQLRKEIRKVIRNESNKRI